MKFGVVVSSLDDAGMNIKENLDNVYVTSESLLDFNEEIKEDFVVFASKHKSESGNKTLTVHPFGNWGKAEYGGEDFSLNESSAIMIKKAFLLLNKYNNLDYEVSLEATHHGPLIDKPGFFIEIGSTKKEWNDKEAGKVIAKVIENLSKFSLDKQISCIVLGGGHYNQIANKLMLKTNYAVGHICPKYKLGFLNKDTLLQAVKKNFPEAQQIVLDWKGLGKFKQKVVTLLEELKLDYVKSKDIL